MKYSSKILVGSLALIGLLSLIPVVRAYQIGKTMPLLEAEKKWGNAPFNAEKFRSGTAEDRAKMIVDIIRKKTFFGKSALEVFQTLGRSDGHFFSDLVPAYLLNEGWKSGVDTWQLVFLLDRNSEKVSEVIIQKNCCDIKP